MWTLLSVPREEGPLPTRPQWRCSHGRMRGIRPTRRPRVLRKVHWHLLQEFGNSEKSVSSRGGYFSSKKAIFPWVDTCFLEQLLFCHFGFLCWGCVCYFLFFFPESTFWPLFGGRERGLIWRWRLSQSCFSLFFPAALLSVFFCFPLCGPNVACRCSFLPRCGPNVACRCSLLMVSGRWVGVAVCVGSRCVGVIGPLAICRARSGALVRRRHRHGAASCASGGVRSISCTVVHLACAVRCAGAFLAVTCTDGWWTTYLGCATSLSAFCKTTCGTPFLLLFCYFNLFCKMGPLHG